MIKVENDYEPVFNEQQRFHSHVYENQLELLHNYYTRAISKNIPAVQEVNKINTLIKPEKEQVQCSITNHIYQNLQKELPKEKIWTIPFLLESPERKKNFNHQILK